MEQFSKALQIAPTNSDAADAIYNIGVVHDRRRDSTQAIKLYTEAIEKKDGTFSLAYCSRAENYRNLGQYALALQDLNKVLSLGIPSVIHNAGIDISEEIKIPRR